MAYQNGKTYYLIPLCATGDAAYNRKILNKQVQPIALNTRGVGSHYNNRNVNVYSLDWSTDMQWKVMIYDGFARILCAGNTAYGLDYYYSTSNPGNPNNRNCDIYQVNGNYEDSKINFRTINASENLYKIQCYRNDADNDLYLTAMGTSNGSDVRWQPLDSSKATQQTWWLVPIEDVKEPSSGGDTGSNSKILPITETVNQWYNGHNNTIRQSGCALCSGLMASMYYGDSPDNTVDYFYSHYWNEYGYTWVSPNSTFTEESTFSLSLIKSEIDNGRPIIVRAYRTTDPENSQAQHWVLAYGYKNNAATESDIYVADPYNSDSSSNTAKMQMLTDAMYRFTPYAFARMKKTNSK